MSPAPALVVARGLRVDPREIQIRFIHASGPGGQNVNKVATAAQLRFNVETSSALSPGIKQRLREIAGNRISKDGELVITARRHRSQARNKEDAIERLRSLLQRASRKRRARVPTSPSRAARRKRLENKSQRGRLKAQRKRPGPND